MSALPVSAARTARAYPLPARPAAAPPPRLRVVRAPEQARSRVPFVIACMAVLAGALLTALLLNTQMASLAFERYALSNELGRLEQERMDLVAELDSRSSPARLAEAATELGMVEANGTGWLRLADGSVQGAPAPAGG